MINLKPHKCTSTMALAIITGIAATVAVRADDSSAGDPITPQTFVWQAGVGGLMEVQLGQMAEEKGTDPSVRDFGRKMVRDHSKANEKLRKIAEKEQLVMPPTNTFAMNTNTAAGTNVFLYWSTMWDKSSAGPGNENMKGGEQMMMTLHSPTNLYYLDIARLSGLSGSSFDQAYADEMVKDHLKDMQEFQEATSQLQDKDLKKFAQKTLPTLQEHYRMAVDMRNKVYGGKAPPM